MTLKSHQNGTHTLRSTKVKGFHFRAELFKGTSPAVVPFFGHWGLAGNGQKRINFNEVRITLVLKRGGKSFTLINNVSLQDWHCACNWRNSTYPVGRYADRWEVVGQNDEKVEMQFDCLLPFGCYDLRGDDTLELRVSVGDLALDTGRLATTSNIVIYNGSTTSPAQNVPYVSEQTGDSFINKATTTIEITPVLATKFEEERATFYFETVYAQNDSSELTKHLGDNVAEVYYLDKKFPRLNVTGFNYNGAVCAINRVDVSSTALNEDLTAPQLALRVAKQFKTENELVDRRNQFALYDMSEHRGADGDNMKVSLGLNSSLVNAQKQCIMYWRYHTDLTRHQIADKVATGRARHNLAKVTKA